VQYDSSLFATATVERLGHAFERLLFLFLEQADSPLGDAVLLSEDDLAALGCLWHESGGQSPSDFRGFRGGRTSSTRRTGGIPESDRKGAGCCQRLFLAL